MATLSNRFTRALNLRHPIVSAPMAFAGGGALAAAVGRAGGLGLIGGGYGDPAWLEWAITLQDRQTALFYDSADGGWFSTTGNDSSVLLRLKEDQDGAEPSAGSLAAHNLIVLGHLVGGGAYLDMAERTLGRYGARAGTAARAIPMMMAALSEWHAEHSQVVVAGDPATAPVRALDAELARHYRPFTVVVPLAPGPRQAELARRLPFVAAMTPGSAGAAAYVCQDFTCQAPVSSAEALAGQLGKPTYTGHP